MVDALVAAGGLELRASYDRERFIAEVVTFLEVIVDHRERAPLFGEWLVKQPYVIDVFASDSELEAAIASWAAAVLPKPKRRSIVAATDFPRDRAMEARILAEPDDADAVAVYRDWLLEHGNPLGELFAFGNVDRSRQQTLATYTPYLWGPLAEHRSLFDLEWGPGGVRAVTITRIKPIEIEYPIVVSWLLELPITIFLRDLRIGPLPSTAVRSFDDIAATIFARPRPGLHTLHLDASQGRNRANLGRLPPLTTLASLRDLAITALRLEFTAIAHPTLTTLTLDIEAATAKTAAAIAAANCPALRDVTLRLTLIEPVRLDAMLAGSGMPNIRRLVVALPLHAPSARVVEGLLGAAYLPSLRELDLSALEFDRPGITALGRARNQLAHIERITFATALAQQLPWNNVVAPSRRPD